MQIPNKTVLLKDSIDKNVKNYIVGLLRIIVMFFPEQGGYESAD